MTASYWITKVEVDRQGRKVTTYHQNPDGSTAWDHPYGRPVQRDRGVERACPACPKTAAA